MAPVQTLFNLRRLGSSFVQLLLLVSSLFILDQSSYHRINGQRPASDKTPVASHLNAINQQPIKIVVPNLDPNHYRFWLKNHPLAFKEFESICPKLLAPTHNENLTHFQSIHSNLIIEDPRYLQDLDYGRGILNTICSKLDLVTKSCWGYENNCNIIYLMPECHGSKSPSPSSLKNEEQEKKIAWFSQADFGYILDRRREMERYCSPAKDLNDTWISSFECTKYFRTCRGQNLYVKFDNVPRNVTDLTLMKQQYQLARGNIGGSNCDLQLKRIPEQAGQEGPLVSWFNELKNYDKISQPTGGGQMCDITIDKQAFIIKLDSTSNMYHYFCNFLNLYATIHLNNKFSDDNQIIIWDNRLPRSPYELMWKAFSRNPLRHIGEFDGKRVCFRRFVFTLLPRMVDGLYYNTPLVSGCSKTGLFHAFNRHILHRLNVTHPDPVLSSPELISVTIVGRSPPLYRRMVNELELEQAIRNRFGPYFSVQLVDYTTRKFDEQLRISRNTDILVGIHGAGLTNLLFLPDWASLIEVHNCSDSSYEDLARLRGVGYYSGGAGLGEANLVDRQQVEDKVELERLAKRKLVGHEKFINYRVDVNKFLTLLERVAEKVKSDKSRKYSRNSMKASGPPKVDLKMDGGSIVNKEHATTTTTAKPHEEL